MFEFLQGVGDDLPHLWRVRTQAMMLNPAVFRKAVGTSVDATTRDILTAFAGESEDERTAREHKV
jgi:hypothetical protein